MKKIICLLFILLLLTGCDVEYNLIIDDETFSEDINFTIPNSADLKSTINFLKKTKQPIYLNEKTNNSYDLKINKKNNYYNINYKYDFNKNNILLSNAINQCYKMVNLDTSGKYYNLTTGGKFLCLFRDQSQIIDNATINIKTDLKVVKHNADKVKDKTYTWKINSENYRNKPIEIKIEKPNTINENAHIYIFIILSIVIIGGILTYFILRKKKELNDV